MNEEIIASLRAKLNAVGRKAGWRINDESGWSTSREGVFYAI